MLLKANVLTDFGDVRTGLNSLWQHGFILLRFFEAKFVFQNQSHVLKSQVFVDSVRNGNVDDDGPVGGHVVEVAQRGVDEDGTAVGSDSVT